MSQRTIIQCFYLILTLEILLQVSYIECGPQAGLVTLITPNATNSTHHYVPATIIERSEPLGNGCFKQTIKEPDYSDLNRFIFTEQLICPPGVNITAVSQQFQAGHRVVPPYAPVFQPPAILPVPVNATPIAVLPPPSVPSAPMPPVITQQKYQPAVFYPQQPVVAEVPNNVASQVMVMSSKTGHYATDNKAKSSANTLRGVDASHIVLLLTVLTYSLM